MPYMIIERVGGRDRPLSLLGRPLVFGTRRRAQILGAYECGGRWRVMDISRHTHG